MSLALKTSQYRVAHLICYIGFKSINLVHGF